MEYLDEIINIRVKPSDKEKLEKTSVNFDLL